MRRGRQIRNRRGNAVLESYVVRETKKAAKLAGFHHKKVKYVGSNGAPDDWFFGFGGELVIIEFKAPGKSPEDHQLAEISRLRRRGFTVYVVDSAEVGIEIFRARPQW